jgi:predicted kinase
MSYYKTPIILTFIGVPGSGKSYFASRAADKIGALRLNSDAMRLSIFGTHENILAAYQSKNRQTVNSYVFGAMDYSTGQILARGIDVLYDANSNKRSDRENAERIALEHGAIAALVYVKTPHDVALQRGQDREANAESRKKSAEEMQVIIDRMKASTEEPTESENVITIDGLAPFDEQFNDFEKQLNIILNKVAD